VLGPWPDNESISAAHVDAVLAKRPLSEAECAVLGVPKIEVSTVAGLDGERCGDGHAVVCGVPGKPVGFVFVDDE
jgi:hypothetical protein